MSSLTAAPPSVSTDGGGAHREHRELRRGCQRRRAKNRRNRAQRSLLHIVGWNAEGLRTKLSELQSWLPTVSADVVAIQEVQLSAMSTFRIPGYQPPVVTRRARGRTSGAVSAKGGDVAIYVRGGLPFVPIIDRLLDPADDSTEVCGVRILGDTNLDIINI